jgi:hypothetical protein
MLSITCPMSGHIFNIWTNITSSLSWMKNMAHDTNPIVRCLVHILVVIIVASGVPCIPGKINSGADCLLRPTLVPSWTSIIVGCPKVELYRHCQVSPTLLSTLASMISTSLIGANDAKEMTRLWTLELVTYPTGSTVSTPP